MLEETLHFYGCNCSSISELKNVVHTGVIQGFNVKTHFTFSNHLISPYCCLLRWVLATDDRVQHIVTWWVFHGCKNFVELNVVTYTALFDCNFLNMFHFLNFKRHSFVFVNPRTLLREGHDVVPKDPKLANKTNTRIIKASFQFDYTDRSIWYPKHFMFLDWVDIKLLLCILVKGRFA